MDWKTEKNFMERLVEMKVYKELGLGFETKDDLDEIEQLESDLMLSKIGIEKTQEKRDNNFSKMGLDMLQDNLTRVILNNEINNWLILHKITDLLNAVSKELMEIRAKNLLHLTNEGIAKTNFKIELKKWVEDYKNKYKNELNEKVEAMKKAKQELIERTIETIDKNE